MAARQPKRYLLFNKPFNVLCQFTAEGLDRRTLADYIDEPGIYPAGRLDFDSEGLLLLTDDGALQHRLTDPRFQHPRTYLVQVEGEITDEALGQLAAGVQVQDYVTRPAKVRVTAEPDIPPRDPPVRFRKHIPTSWIELTLTEGRNRQVRRMTAAVGFPTLRLIRVAIGTLQIGDLRPGAWRGLKGTDVERLLSARSVLL